MQFNTRVLYCAWQCKEFTAVGDNSALMELTILDVSFQHLHAHQGQKENAQAAKSKS